MNSFDAFVRDLTDNSRRSVRAATIKVSRARTSMLPELFEDVENARKHAAQVKDYVLDHLSDLLVEFETACQCNGIQVHWAANAEQARRVIRGLCEQHAASGSTIVKAKSMATEEIHLNEALIDAGFDVVETDLGEFVVQLDEDTPSHLVAPIIHKSRHDVARAFERHGLPGNDATPEVLAAIAREHLRQKFQSASIGISGVNFGIVESGRIVLVENEGNNRLSTTAPRTHIAVMGIEKLLPRESDLPLFLKLLAGSATGQRLTVYTHLISGPRTSDELDGPDHVHLVLIDNGRSKVVAGPYRSVLRCLRCGACLNTCPVYRQSSGHAYGHVYSGPIGAVLAPALEGVEKLGELAKASTLCGQCEEVCPVKIPIPQLLLELRSQWMAAQRPTLRVPFIAFSTLAQNDARWRLALSLIPLLSQSPSPWTSKRENPKRQGREFRRWWDQRS